MLGLTVLAIFAALLLGLSACGPLAQEEPRRGWDIPMAPQEKAAYDYAHSLKLPDSVPKPVPFSFTAARIKALWPANPSVSEQYFEHLCQTEAGEYIFKTVENVEGLFQMRPRLHLDPAIRGIGGRYRLEDPTGASILDGDSDIGPHGNVDTYVQPMFGTYSFLERPSPGGNGVIRFVRGDGVTTPPPYPYQKGYPTVVRGQQVRVPYLVNEELSTERKARYGYTWRGITRELDRDLNIGGGEYLVVDLDTREVLAVKRGFRTKRPYPYDHTQIHWDTAVPCKSERTLPYWDQGRELFRAPPVDRFIKKVLRPIAGLNDQYIPPTLRTHKN